MNYDDEVTIPFLAKVILAMAVLLFILGSIAK